MELNRSAIEAGLANNIRIDDLIEFITPYVLPALQIIWIDILLSGDNAVVIALACRNLPPEQRRLGVIIGAGAAIGLRVLFTLVANSLLGLPWIKFVGGILLFWIAIKLLLDENGDDETIKPADNLRKAIQTIAIADLVMSLDNILAIAAVAKGDWGLIIFGLLASIPLVVWGSQLILSMLHRAPWIVWAGAALLGWVAGDIMMADKGLVALMGFAIPHYTLPLPWGSTEIGLAPLIGAIFVLLVGWVFTRRRTIQSA